MSNTYSYLGIEIHRKNPDYITDFSKTLLEGHYMREGENLPQALARPATAFCFGDYELAQRIYDYAYNGWFMYASPVLSNAPKGKWVQDEEKTGAHYWHKSFFIPEEKHYGLPISCFAAEMPDTAKGQVEFLQELAVLSMSGGGMGAHNSIRGTSGKAPGPIPYMKVVDSAIGYFRQGKCYSPETEIFTSQGWIRFDNLKGNESVAQVSDFGTIHFVTPTEFVKEKHVGKMIRLFNENRGLDISVTPDHSMVLQRKKITGWDFTLEKVRADSIKFHNEVRFIISPDNGAKGEKYTLTPEEKLRIAFQADGHNAASSAGSHPNAKSGLEFHLFKARKIDRLRNILTEGGYEFSEKVTDEKTVRFYVKKTLHMEKGFSWIDLGTLEKSKAVALVDEISKWDSHVKPSGTFTYSTTVKTCADQVQAIALIAGRQCRLTVHEREQPKNTIYTLYFSHNNYLGLENISKEEYEYDGYVYCVTVPTGKIIVRKNGVTLVCGNTRRGAIASYMNVDHPDILEHIRFRVPGGDPKRRSDNRTQFHCAVNLTDKFIEAVKKDEKYDLICPHSGRVFDTLSARMVWEDILETRALTGEPYLMKIDLANRKLPESQKKLGLRIRGSNLCSEIVLPTDELRTFVCCLSSLNLERFDEWKDSTIVQDLIRFLDNVLQYFIDNAPETLSKGKYSAERERALGLGTLGWHGLLQSKGIPMESGGFNSAVQLTHQVYSLISKRAEEESRKLAVERGEAPDMVGTGLRNSRLSAIAPNSNSADLVNTSPSIEPWYRNIFVKDTRAGSFVIKNKYLEALLDKKEMNVKAVWNSILEHDGSVQHLTFLTPEEKAVFKTAVEMDQHWLVELANQRGQYISQAQSLNLFFQAGMSRAYVNSVHLKFLESEHVLTLYYYRNEREGKIDSAKDIERKALTDWSEKGEECVACQG